MAKGTYSNYLNMVLSSHGLDAVVTPWPYSFCAGRLERVYTMMTEIAIRKTAYWNGVAWHLWGIPRTPGDGKQNP